MPELHIHRSGDDLITEFGEHRATTLWSNIASLKLTAEKAREYGRDLFDSMTQNAELRDALVKLPKNSRLVLLVEEPEVAAIPWEYMRFSDRNGGLLLA